LVRKILEVQVLSAVLSVSFLLEWLHADNSFFQLQVLGTLEAFLSGLDLVELNIPVSSGLSVRIVAHNRTKNAPELRKLLV